MLKDSGMHGGMEVPTGQLFRLNTNNNVNGLSDIKSISRVSGSLIVLEKAICPCEYQ